MADKNLLEFVWNMERTADMICSSMSEKWGIEVEGGTVSGATHPSRMKVLHTGFALLLIFPLIATSQGSENNRWTGDLGMSPPKSLRVPQFENTAVRDESGKVMFKALYAPMPVYPKRPRYDEGRGLFLLRLRSNGTVLAVEVERSTGAKEFDLAASEALIRWRYPANTNVTRVYIPINFKRPSPLFHRSPGT